MARRALHDLGRRIQHRGISYAARKLRFESLENRHMLATFTVTNLADAAVTAADSAPGTLRQAIYDANQSEGADLIQFANGLNGNIQLSVADDSAIGPSALLITSEMTIRGNGSPITIQRDTLGPEMRLIHVASGGNLKMEYLSLFGGLARGAHGDAGQNGSAGLGGAIYNEGTTWLVASTVYGNSAIGGNAGSGANRGPGLGGAIYNEGGTVTLHNATLSGNTASSGTGGSAVSSFAGAVYGRNGEINIYNSTLTTDTATAARELYVLAVGNGNVAIVNIFSSIIAEADHPLLLDVNVTHDDDGSQLSVHGANNLIRLQNDYQSITITTEAPLLGPLADNGGPTLTHALLPDSPAIGHESIHGSNLLGFTTDQRGGVFTRASGDAIDIGAFELQPIPTPALPGDYNRNNDVDAADYVVWRKTQDTTGVPQYSGADGNGDTVIDSADYGVWRGQFGMPQATSASILLSTAGDSAIATQLSTQPVDAAPVVPRDAGSLDQSAPNFGWYAANLGAGKNNRMPAKRNRSVVPQQVRDDALLAIIEEHSFRRTSFAVGSWADDTDTPLDQCSSSDTFRSTEHALSRDLLQTPVSV